MNVKVNVKVDEKVKAEGGRRKAESGKSSAVSASQR